MTTLAPDLSVEEIAALRVLARKREAAKPSELEKYRGDPVGFVREVLGEHLWSKQREIAESVRDNRHTAVHSAHDTGKSYLAGRLAAWWLSCHPAGEAFVVTTAPTFPQVRAILWREINRAHTKGKLPGRVNQTEWFIGNEIVAYGRKPADYDETAFQGIHARYVLVILDEGGGIPKSLFDAAETLTTNEGSRVLVIGNPDSPLTEFKRVCDPGSGWNVIHVDGLESPNFTAEEVPEEIRDLLLSPTWVAERKKAWGEDSALYESKVRGRFPRVAQGQVHKWLLGGYQWVGPLPHFNRIVGGLDFGSTNEDAHKTAGVVAGLFNHEDLNDEALLRFAHFEHGGQKVHDQLVKWMHTVEGAVGRRITWRADKTQSWGISLITKPPHSFIVVPTEGGADSVWNGIQAQTSRGSKGLSFYTEELTMPPVFDGEQLNGRSWYDAMSRYRWQQQPDEDKAVPGVPIKRDDDTPDADRYMVEEADGFPTYTGPAIQSLSGRPRARNRSAA